MLLCASFIYDAYEANLAPSVTAQTPVPIYNVTQKRLQKNIGTWKATLAKQDILLACPYLGHDFVARIDLPDKRSVTLDAWDFGSEAKVAHVAYTQFVQARRQARVANPESCLVHVFDSTGVEVAQASQQGVLTSQYAPLPGSEN